METPQKEEAKLSEMQLAVASIICDGSNNAHSSEISATDPYIPSCTNSSTQTEDQIKGVEVETQTERNLKVSVG